MLFSTVSLRDRRIISPGAESHCVVNIFKLMQRIVATLVLAAKCIFCEKTVSAEALAWKAVVYVVDSF